ncbi:hypothetical protein JCM10212_002045 [Sporobolomyces blumeae]
MTSTGFSPPPATRSTAFISSVYPTLPDRGSPSPHRLKPFVTLTYAQSLDAKIAGKDRKQIILSGPESMELTHRLREWHDSILVGIGTVLNDNPQLIARIPSMLPVDQQPTPIVLDRHLETPPGCRLIENFTDRKIGKRPVIVCDETYVQTLEGRRRKEALEQAGATVVDIPSGSNGRIELSSLVRDQNLARHLGRSLMIEGGSAVLSSFIASPDVDRVVVTVAPVFVGEEGVGIVKPGTRVPRLHHLATQLFGRDTVFAGQPIQES